MSDKQKVTVILAKQELIFRKVGIYCRVSTRSQEQMNSLANQASFLTRLASYRFDWRLVDIYLDVGSGSKEDNRAEFQRMLRDCGSEKLDIVLTKSISRFGKNTIETLRSINELRILGIEVVFDQENINTKNSDSQVLISLLEGIAQEENEERSKNILWGMTRKAEEGTSSLYRRRCYGYFIDENGDLRINESEAKVICDIFKMYLQGKSVLGILKELEARGVKSPTGKDRWPKRSIDTMLSNDKYYEDATIFKRYSIGFPNTKRIINEPSMRKMYQAIRNHPAIISKEAFNEVQAERERRSNVIRGSEGAIRKSTRYSSLKDIRARNQEERTVLPNNEAADIIG